MSLLRLESLDSTLPTAHIGISRGYMTAQDDASYVWSFHFRKAHPCVERKPDLNHLRKTENESRRVGTRLIKKSIGEELRKGKAFCLPWEIVSWSTFGSWVLFSITCRECFPPQKILLLANSNHSPEGNFL